MRAGVWLGAAVAAAGVTLAALPAFAEEGDSYDLDWRQSSRSDHYERRHTEFPHWVFELRFGGYSPRIDSEPALHGATPYADVFDTDPQFYLGTEVDWVPLRVPFLGAFGPGLGFGWTNASTNAKINIPGDPKGNCQGTLNGCKSAETTSLTIFPIYAVGVFRLDEPMARWGIPIVPYVKFGVDAELWTTGTSVSKTYSNNAGKSVGSGDVTWGLHFAAGGQLLLNWLDQDAVNRSREASGVRNFYAFFEYADYGFSPLRQNQLRVGSGTWVVGVAVDL